LPHTPGAHAAEIHILSAGTALPGPLLDNATLARRFGVSETWEQWIDAFVGISSRHLAIDLDTGEVRYSLADLGETAASRALAAAGLDAASVDLMVMSTATPDMLMPATVNMIADRLGIDGVPTYQLQSGCAGAIAAINVARQLLETGRYRTALVIGGDVIAKHYDLSANAAAAAPAQMINGVLFGDGAGAAVLSTEPTSDATVIRSVLLRLVGRNRAPGQTVEWFGMADRGSDRPAVTEDYKAIEESVPVLASEILAELLSDLDWSETDIDYLLPPQLSGKMTARIVERLALPYAKEITCVRETGNTGNALPFFQLERLLPLLTTGDCALGIAVESSKWIKSGFALEKA
jgi:3-oxoacyl-[acyl-carrier-protein] synthase III